MPARVEAASVARDFASSRRYVVWMFSASLVLNSLIYPPSPLGWLSFVCLVPCAVAVCRSPRAGWVYWGTYIFGWLFYFIGLRWVWMVAYVPIGSGLKLPAGAMGMALVLATYFVLIAVLIRHLVQRHGIRMTLVLPVAWVACEYVRGEPIEAFPWFFLAHCHYRNLLFIQISDVVGAYGVSFLVAMVNGLLGDLVLRRALAHIPLRPRLRWCVGLLAVLLALTFGYGRYQLAASKRTIAEGPRVAVIQGNYVLEVQPGGGPNDTNDKRRTYERLMIGAAEHRPDAFVLPESPWPMVLNKEYLEYRSVPPPPGQEWSQHCHDWLSDAARQTGAYVVTGAFSHEFYPEQEYPTEGKFNSAFVFPPDGGEVRRYDKVHLVLFGEYVPLRGGRLHFVYQWLNNITPWGQNKYEYSLFPGDEFVVFEMAPQSQPGRRYRFGIPICYEDVMPYIARAFSRVRDGRKSADFLLNISNDGWFRHGDELVQHLAASVFRAVENRVGIARAVNTGISGFVDPNGRVYGEVSVGGRTRGDDVEGFSVQPVYVDSRVSLYTRWGDWFAIGLSLVCAAALLDAWVLSRLLGRRGSAAGSDVA